jgi:hypothetical protein
MLHGIKINLLDFHKESRSMMEQTREQVHHEVARHLVGQFGMEDDDALTYAECVDEVYIAREQSLKERQREVLERIRKPLDSINKYFTANENPFQYAKAVEQALSIINSELKDRG